MLQRRASLTQLIFLPVGRFAPGRIFERRRAADAHIRRALMTNPGLILLDEPIEGLAPLIVNLLEEQMMRLKESGLTVLLAEQNQVVTLRLADRGDVIDNGAIRFHGTRRDLAENEEVRRKYLSKRLIKPEPGT
jgi:ABC-type branched-subunit amino acid transport system ATPase component